MQQLDLFSTSKTLINLNKYKKKKLIHRLFLKNILYKYISYIQTFQN